MEELKDIKLPKLSKKEYEEKIVDVIISDVIVALSKQYYLVDTHRISKGVCVNYNNIKLKYGPLTEIYGLFTVNFNSEFIVKVKTDIVKRFKIEVENIVYNTSGLEINITTEGRK